MAQRDGVFPAEEFPWQLGICIEDEGEGARPKGVHKRFGEGRNFGGQCGEICPVWNENNDRFFSSPTFGLKEPRKGLPVERVNTESVNGFGGVGHEAALFYAFGCLEDIFRCWSEDHWRQSL